MTLQRKRGKTPHRLRAEADEALDALRTERDRLVSEIRDADDAGNLPAVRSAVERLAAL
jgi:hypothetical protein